MAEVEGDYGGATVVERMVLLPKAYNGECREQQASE